MIFMATGATAVLSGLLNRSGTIKKIPLNIFADKVLLSVQ